MKYLLLVLNESVINEHGEPEITIMAPADTLNMSVCDRYWKAIPRECIKDKFIARAQQLFFSLDIV